MSCYNIVFFCNREKALPYLAVVVRSLAANCSARERLHIDRLQRSFHGGFAELRIHDQDTLNLIFRGNILSLSPKWNMLEYAQLYRDWPFELYRDTEPPLEYFETRIRHFAGPTGEGFQDIDVLEVGPGVSSHNGRVLKKVRNIGRGGRSRKTNRVR